VPSRADFRPWIAGSEQAGQLVPAVVVATWTAPGIMVSNTFRYAPDRSNAAQMMSFSQS